MDDDAAGLADEADPLEDEQAAVRATVDRAMAAKAADDFFMEKTVLVRVL